MKPKDLLQLIRDAGFQPKKCFNGWESNVGVVCEEDDGEDPDAILADMVNRVARDAARAGCDASKEISFLITRFVRFPIARRIRYFWQSPWPTDVPDPEES